MGEAAKTRVTIITLTLIFVIFALGNACQKLATTANETITSAATADSHMTLKYDNDPLVLGDGGTNRSEAFACVLSTLGLAKTQAMVSERFEAEIVSTDLLTDAVTSSPTDATFNILIGYSSTDGCIFTSSNYGQLVEAVYFRPDYTLYGAETYAFSNFPTRLISYPTSSPKSISFKVDFSPVAVTNKCALQAVLPPKDNSGGFLDHVEIPYNQPKTLSISATNTGTPNSGYSRRAPYTFIVGRMVTQGTTTSFVPTKLDDPRMVFPLTIVFMGQQTGFSDIPYTDRLAPYAPVAKAWQVALGYNNGGVNQTGTFGVNDPTIRLHLSAFIARALAGGVTALSGDCSALTNYSFDDISSLGGDIALCRIYSKLIEAVDYSFQLGADRSLIKAKMKDLNIIKDLNLLGTSDVLTVSMVRSTIKAIGGFQSLQEVPGSPQLGPNVPMPRGETLALLARNYGVPYFVP